MNSLFVITTLTITCLDLLGVLIFLWACRNESKVSSGVVIFSILSFIPFVNAFIGLQGMLILFITLSLEKSIRNPFHQGKK